jgi:hypothetical protein
VSKWRRTNRRPLDEFIESIPFPETRNYVKRVTILRETYRELSERGEPVSMRSATKAGTSGAPPPAAVGP